MLAALLVVVAALASGAGWLADQHPTWNAPISSADRYSQASFDRWLAEDPGRRDAFTEFDRLLTKQGVSGIVPSWQLLRTDVNDRIGCLRPAFLLPERKMWGNIVPTLRLLKQHVIPVIGPVEVVSSFRTVAFNACVNGAGQSRHLSFSAIDLVARSERSNRELFQALCALHDKLGPASRFGLGAYFDPKSDGQNRHGRFHVDATGYRTWGFSKRAGSSGCRLLASTSVPSSSL